MPTAWSFGGDPEYFMAKPGGGVVPAHLVFPAKDKPLETGSGKIYRDGYAVELNPMYSYCRETLASNHHRLRNYAKNVAKKCGYTILTRAAVLTKPEHFKNAPEDVLRFGCDASNCAYDFVEKRPQPEQGHPYRYGGGHMHLGATTGGLVAKWDGRKGDPAWMKRDEDAALFMRMLDLKVGIPLAFLFNDKKQLMRRQMYGQAGEFRFQPYNATTFGLEYRTPPADTWMCTPVLSYCMGMMRYVAVNFADLKKSWDRGIEGDVRESINLLEKPEALLRHAVTHNISTLGLFRKLDEYVHSPLGKRWRGGHFGWHYFQGRTGSREILTGI